MNGTKICSVDGCGLRHKARGYCGAHYSGWFRTTTAAERKIPTREERFWGKVNKRGVGECWYWTANLNDGGYGIFHDGERLVRAHRFSYELITGKIPDGLVVDHTCHNDSGCSDVPCAHRKCVNPAHLQKVTQQTNCARGRGGEHQKLKTHCPKGHPYSSENTYYSKGGRVRTCKICRKVTQAKYNAKRKAV